MHKQKQAISGQKPLFFVQNEQKGHEKKPRQFLLQLLQAVQLFILRKKARSLFPEHVISRFIAEYLPGEAVHPVLDIPDVRIRPL